ncbi:MAG: biotin/lipoyl-binding protein [Prevotella sp.]|nr:biotin/lipoyl-binding protein [Prevotella sp.]
MSNKYQYKVQGVDYEVEIEEVEGTIAKVKVNGIPFEVELRQPISAAKHPTIVRPKVAAPVAAAPTTVPPATPAAAPTPAGAPITGNIMKAPLPGTITRIPVKVGDKVNVGDVVIVLEAMKMQNNIEAEYAGTVTAINVNAGDSVMEGAVLLTIQS